VMKEVAVVVKVIPVPRYAVHPKISIDARRVGVQRERTVVLA
jgi:hypothetical protein